MKSDEIPRTDGSIRTPTHGQAHPSKRILVVDDDRSIRQVSVDVLTAFGYQVDSAEDGVAGWEAFHTNCYDLLITDNKMPKVSGVELVKKLRSARATLPVVLVSGDIPTEELNGNPSLQLSATLVKPFSAEELLGIVEIILSASEVASSRIGIQHQFERSYSSFALG